MEKSPQCLMKALYNTPAQCLALLLMNTSAMFEIACAHLPCSLTKCGALSKYYLCDGEINVQRSVA